MRFLTRCRQGGAGAGGMEGARPEESVMQEHLADLATFFHGIPTCACSVRCIVLRDSPSVRLTGAGLIRDATPPVVFLIAHMTRVATDSELTEPGPKTIDTLCQRISGTLLEEGFSQSHRRGATVAFCTSLLTLLMVHGCQKTFFSARNMVI